MGTMKADILAAGNGAEGQLDRMFGIAGRRAAGGRSVLGRHGRGIVPVTPTLRAEIKFFGRYQRGWIRDGVILSLNRDMLRPRAAKFSGSVVL